MAFCNKCGKEVHADDMFCKNCGNKIVKVCLKCGKTVQLDDLFCINCGNMVEEDKIDNSKDIIAQEPKNEKADSASHNLKNLLSDPVSSNSKKVFSAETSAADKEEKKNKPAKRNIIIGFIFAIGIAFAIIGAAVSAENKDSHNNPGSVLCVLSAIMIFVGIIAIIITLIGKCPKCGRSFAIEEISRRELDRKEGYETITRKDETKDKKGNVLWTTDRKEQVFVEEVVYEKFLKCKYCGHSYSEQETEKYVK